MCADNDEEDQPRWLNSQEMRAWRSLIGMAMKLPAALDSQLQRDAGLTHFEFAVLVTLSEAPEQTLRMSELATLTNGSQSRLSHVARRMERNRLIERHTNSSDKRSTFATLTEQGWSKLKAAVPGHVEAVRHLVFDQIPDEKIEALAQVAQAILDAVESDSSAPKLSNLRKNPVDNEDC
ncbi:MarR family winged helix-turn-helix transcriptional regulator [Natronoglycomyces albus]|uniref:MarR family transcriptional regulator n=1 Tax=Natronoglycomyces albus TaxID=2811108 RepID=A0A895XRV0_9ACTN|nr:MarR family transcriptional regulator [Natronoglycomyces albus]QSB05905.1 MarR family transcriptional regulator [Natronoglycomyces albus]